MAVVSVTTDAAPLREASEPAIVLKNAHLDLPLRERSLENILRRARPRAAGGRIRSARSGDYVKVLSDVSLTVEHGARLGLIGVNGAGKSSLLRLMAGIYTPTQGVCEIHGRVSTLFTNTIGMNNEASGRENIYLSARTLGLSKKEIAEIIPEVIEFAELGDFIDLPLRVYSAGMRTRLGFGVATSMHPEILLVDEVFGVGDRSFRARAQKRIEKVMGTAGALVLATHAANILQEFCDRICWIDNGEVRFFGDVAEGLEAYSASGLSL